MLYKDIEKRKRKIKLFLRKNPNATYNQIKRILHIKIEKVYLGGMKEAFKDSGIESPRNFDKKTKEERRRIIINCIKENPIIGGHTIAKKTKINPSNVFKNIKEAYDLAEVEYPRFKVKKSKEQKRYEIISQIKNNPLITAKDIKEITGINLYKVFKNFNEAYKQAGIKNIHSKNKELIKKQTDIINFIKNNNFATQREINKGCKTHVQEIFNGGIFEAYKNAEVNFPYEQLKLYGIGLKEIRDRAKNFEDEIAIKLSGYGKVNRLIRTKRGVADVIFERKNKKAIIEIKDYKLKEISISQINQLNKYLEDCNCNLGFLICHEKPKKDSFIIGKNKIFILDKDRLESITNLM